MPIKMKSGKDYYTVVERMDMMIEEKGREDYSLETEVTYESGVVIVKATLTLFNCYPKDETDTVEVVSRKYVGHALGELGKAKTLEATETHAIGRALSSAGWYGSELLLKVMLIGKEMLLMKNYKEERIVVFNLKMLLILRLVKMNWKMYHFN